MSVGRRTPRPLPTLGLVAAALLGLHACGDGDGGTQPPPPSGTSGVLSVRLTGPAGNDDRAVLLEVSGPGIDSLSAPGGVEMWQSGSGGARKAVVTGALRSGTILRIHVPDTDLAGSYSVRVVEVAGASYELRDAGAYGAILQ